MSKFTLNVVEINSNNEKIGFKAKEGEEYYDVEYLSAGEEGCVSSKPCRTQEELSCAYTS